MAESFSPVASGFVILILIWLGSITYFLFRFISRYNTLIGNTNKRNLQAVIETAIQESKRNQNKVEVLTKQVEQQEKMGASMFQKVSLARFNPFSNNGGEQSFVVALLDQKNNGIVFTSLQSRSGTRWYAKQVKEGKGTEFELSKEESEAVQKAKPLL